MKQRLQALNSLDRALTAASDDDLAAAIAALDDEATKALASVVDGDAVTVDALRAAAEHGRLSGELEGIAYAVSERCLDDCIGELGDSSDNPTADELNAVLPGLIERHGVGMTRLMLASVNVGDAPAAPLLRDILKNHETLALPPAVDKPLVTRAPVVLDAKAEAMRAELKAKRHEAKQRKQADARARREQVARARNR